MSQRCCNKKTAVNARNKILPCMHAYAKEILAKKSRNATGILILWDKLCVARSKNWLTVVHALKLYCMMIPQADALTSTVYTRSDFIFMPATPAIDYVYNSSPLADNGSSTKFAPLANHQKLEISQWLHEAKTTAPCMNGLTWYQNNT